MNDFKSINMQKVKPIFSPVTMNVYAREFQEQKEQQELRMRVIKKEILKDQYLHGQEMFEKW